MQILTDGTSPGGEPRIKTSRNERVRVKTVGLGQRRSGEPLFVFSHLDTNTLSLLCCSDSALLLLGSENDAEAYTSLLDSHCVSEGQRCVSPAPSLRLLSLFFICVHEAA